MSELKILKRSGLAGAVLGAVALLVCELPLIVGFVGLGALSPAMGVAVVMGVLFVFRVRHRRANPKVRYP